METANEPVVSAGAIGRIVRRVIDRLDEIADAMIATYRDQIPEYAATATAKFNEDVRSMSVENLVGLLDHLERGQLLDDEALADIRTSAARRVHQNVPLDALLHAYRLWGELAWESILTATDRGSPAELNAALKISGRVIQHLNLVSSEATRGYLTELHGVHSDRDGLLNELVNELTGGRGNDDRADQLASALSIPISPSYRVVLASTLADRTRDGSLARAALNRRGIAVAKHALEAGDEGAVVVSRREQILALVPSRVDAAAAARNVAANVAKSLAEHGFCVGLGGAHPGAAGVHTGFGEAREALEIAIEHDEAGQQVWFDDVMIDSILRSSDLTSRLVEAMLGPLRRQDEGRDSQLEATLRAYVDSGFSTAATARAVNVHANTIVYRLGRIHELTGRNPRNPDDLASLALAVRGAKHLEARREVRARRPRGDLIHGRGTHA